MRRRLLPPQLEASGDTPVITKGDVSSREYSIYQEDLSLLWSEVYRVRALILRVERLKQWPYDETEPALSQKHLEEAVLERDAANAALKSVIRDFIGKHGEIVAHGQAEFAVEGLQRLLESG